MTIEQDRRSPPRPKASSLPQDRVQSVSARAMLVLCACLAASAVAAGASRSDHDEALAGDGAPSKCPAGMPATSSWRAWGQGELNFVLPPEYSMEPTGGWRGSSGRLRIEMYVGVAEARDIVDGYATICAMASETWRAVACQSALSGEVIVQLRRDDAPDDDPEVQVIHGLHFSGPADSAEFWTVVRSCIGAFPVEERQTGRSKGVRLRLWPLFESSPDYCPRGPGSVVIGLVENMGPQPLAVLQPTSDSDLPRAVPAIDLTVRRDGLTLTRDHAWPYDVPPVTARSCSVGPGQAILLCPWMPNIDISSAGRYRLRMTCSTVEPLHAHASPGSSQLGAPRGRRLRSNAIRLDLPACVDSQRL
jgi:hypothetical protein